VECSSDKLCLIRDGPHTVQPNYIMDLIYISARISRRLGFVHLLVWRKLTIQYSALVDLLRVCAIIHFGDATASNMTPRYLKLLTTSNLNVPNYAGYWIIASVGLYPPTRSLVLASLMYIYYFSQNSRKRLNIYLVLSRVSASITTSSAKSNIHTCNDSIVTKFYFQALPVDANFSCIYL
jgi:hypothetical protein